MTPDNRGRQGNDAGCKGPAHRVNRESCDSISRLLDDAGSGISILDYHGTIPILAISGGPSTDDGFILDKYIFQQHPSWRWFIREILAYEDRYFPRGASSNAKGFVLVNNTSHRCRLKGFFSYQGGPPFDGIDIFLKQQAILNHARQIGEIPYD